MSEPLSQEILDQIGHETEHASKKVLKRFRKEAVAGFLILALGLGIGTSANNHTNAASRVQIVKSGQAVAVSGCNRDFRFASGLRGVLYASRDFQAGALKRGDISRDRYKLAVRFYKTQLQALPLPDCRVAKEILTDDPNAKIVVPQPLYPGGPGTEGTR